MTGAPVDVVNGPTGVLQVYVVVVVLVPLVLPYGAVEAICPAGQGAGWVAVDGGGAEHTGAHDWPVMVHGE